MIEIKSEFNLNEQLSRPLACVGCQHYDGTTHAGHLLVCGIHPYGWEDSFSCPDFANTITDITLFKAALKTIQPDVQVIQEGNNKIRLKGKFVSRTGTDDIEYFTRWKLQSASIRGSEEYCTYVYR